MTVVEMRSWLAARRRWDRLAELRPWRVAQHDVTIVESRDRDRPGQMKIGRR